MINAEMTYNTYFNFKNQTNTLHYQIHEPVKHNGTY